jgi:tetratricopeptide (TPR) repeat protein
MTIEQVKSALRAGQVSEAIELCERALRTGADASARAELLHLRAVAEQAGGDLERALRFALDALKQDPALAKASNTLAILQHRAGRTIQAIEAAQAAISADPNMAEGHMTLASLYRARRRPKRAADAYRRALEIDPASHPALTGLAETLRETGDAEGALNAYREIRRLRPGDPEVHKSIAATLVYAGKPEEAAREADRSLTLQPDNLTALKIRLEHGPLEGAETAEAAARRVTEDPSAPWQARASLLVARARRAERQGDRDAAFRLWEEKNRVAAEARAYPRETMNAYVETIRFVWSPELASKMRCLSSRPERPVLVLGMPRSGTTLVEQILGGHERVSPGGELYDLGDLTHNFMPGRTIGRVREIPDAKLEARLRQMSSIYADALVQYGDAGRVVIDKMPENFKLVGLAAVLMPKLRVVHVRRDPRDVCFSIWKLQFDNEGHAYGNRFEDLAHYYRVHEELIAHWKSIFPGLVRTVRYEELVADPVTEGRRLVEHCGLDWSPDLLDFSGSRRAVRTASATQVREGLNMKGVGRWRAYADRLGPMIDALRAEGLLEGGAE